MDAEETLAITSDDSHNDATAQLQLAAYFDDIGDTSQAFFWYKRAANNGDAAAQYHLGIFYEHGWGVEQNDEIAEYWYKKSASQSQGHRICPGGAISPYPQKNLHILILRADWGLPYIFPHHRGKNPKKLECPILYQVVTTQITQYFRMLALLSCCS